MIKNYYHIPQQMIYDIDNIEKNNKKASKGLLQNLFRGFFLRFLAGLKLNLFNLIFFSEL